MPGASIRVTTLKWFGEEAEVSSTIVYLLSRAASHIKGTCIRIDGGASSVNLNAVDVGDRAESVAFRASGT
jgi:citronellol/citronellal dehydrogenase